MKKIKKCYINNIPGLEKTQTGKRKIWFTDGVPTRCCSLKISYFVYEKNTKYNLYNRYSGYINERNVEFIN